MCVIQHLSVKVFVPHIIDGAAGSSHQHRPSTKQGQHAQMGEAARVCRQADAPGAWEVQQPRPCNPNTLLRGDKKILYPNLRLNLIKLSHICYHAFKTNWTAILIQQINRRRQIAIQLKLDGLMFLVLWSDSLGSQPWIAWIYGFRRQLFTVIIWQCQ